MHVRTLALRMIASLLAAALLSGCTLLGYERSHNLADDIDGTVEAMDAYGASRTEAFNSLSVLVAEPRSDLTSKYSDFSGDVERVVAAEERLRDALAEMRMTAKARFLAWSTANQSYEDRDMRLGSQQARSDAAESFESTVVEADLMLVQSAAFVAYIKDLSRVLSNDLTDSGVSGVSNYTQKARGFDAELAEMSKPIRTRLVAAADAIHAKSTRN